MGSGRVGQVVIETSDEVLAGRAAGGDEEAFRHLYRRHVGRVRGLLYQMTGESESLDDLTQEVFVKVFRALGNFRGDASFSTWLFRVAVNCC